MTYEECNWLSGLNQQRREKICRRTWMIRMGIQWGGWALAALMLVLEVLA